MAENAGPSAVPTGRRKTPRARDTDVLDMFPYPSGAGLHVGHPLGYIASDIYTRYKRLKGFNVLHPMGYDAFGLPAEQYAIQTGQHPAVTTERNIARYREQLDKIGFSFDWDREVRTCDPKYYHWTQWAFLKMYGSYYSYDENRAMPIERLVEAFDRSGTEGLNVACTKELSFTAARWKAMDEAEREGVLQNYRLAFRADTLVNWCPELGTVLANDEVKDGLSVRGGYPVVQKRMKQWLLRVTAYAQRMLDGLDTLEWSDSLKEIQRNWIGRSEGAQIFFGLKGFDEKLEVFTTRADTIFGATFMVLAPEHALVGGSPRRSSARRSSAISRRRKTLRARAHGRHEARERTVHRSLCDQSVQRDARYRSISATTCWRATERGLSWPFRRTTAATTLSQSISTCRSFRSSRGATFRSRSYDAKAGRMINSDFLTGMDVKEAIPAMIAEVERRGFGQPPGQLSPSRRDFQPPAVLGRAVPDLLQGRHRPPARRGLLAAGASPDRELRSDGRGRAAVGARRGMADARRVSVRAEHDARFRRIVGLLPALHGPA